MATCKDCPISLVCIATGLHFTKRRYEHCRACGKSWVGYWTTTLRWNIVEAPCPLSCPTGSSKPDIITCERCIYEGIKQKHPSPDSLSFVTIKPTGQRVLNFVSNPRPFTKPRRIKQLTTNLLATPIHLHKVHVTPELQLTFRYFPPTLKDMEDLKQEAIAAASVPRKYLFPEKKGNP